MKNSDTFIHGIKQTLDHTPLDSDTRQQLTRARMRALEPPAARSALSTSFLKPALAFASLAIITLAVSLFMQPQPQTAGADIIQSLDIITSRDELEMYENLEFYLWLDEELKS